MVQLRKTRTLSSRGGQAVEELLAEDEVATVDRDEESFHVKESAVWDARTRGARLAE